MNPWFSSSHNAHGVRCHLALALALGTVAISAPALAAPEFQFGVGAGAIFMDDLEVTGSTLTVNPRLSMYVDRVIGFELDVGILPSGTTKDVGEYPYSGFLPRFNVIGRLWTDRTPKGDIKPPSIPLYPTLSAGIGGWYRSIDDGGALGEDFANPDLDFMVNAGPGLMYELGPLVLRTDLRWLLTVGTENYRQRGDVFMNWEWTAGASFRIGGDRTPPVPDTDGDGILDDVDKCINEPEDFDGFQDEDGCPDPDNDGDGILDIDDDCRDEAEDLDGFEDEDGCPDPDNDQDGVLDVDDACPDEPGPAETQGCPDRDGDGVIDALDECPDTPGDPNAFGCVDTDGDGVPDIRDECPDQHAGEGIDPLHSDGCPSRVYFTTTELVITEKVFFATGKAVIERKSFGLLDDVAAVMLKYPDIKKIEVQGHTDNTGDAARNLELSQERADAVRDYLVGKGINTERLVAKGYGPDKPKADNATNEGRTLNRRVQFELLEKDQIIDDRTLRLQERLRGVRSVKPAPEATDKAPEATPAPEVEKAGEGGKRNLEEAPK